MTVTAWKIFSTDSQVSLVSQITSAILSCCKMGPLFLIAHLPRSEEHTPELQSQSNLVCRLLLETKNELPGVAQIIVRHAMQLKEFLRHTAFIAAKDEHGDHAVTGFHRVSDPLCAALPFDSLHDA